MRKLIFLAAIAAALMILENPANAIGRGGNTRLNPGPLVDCPSGTCNPKGGHRAVDRAFCTREHCRK